MFPKLRLQEIITGFNNFFFLPLLNVLSKIKLFVYVCSRSHFTIPIQYIAPDIPINSHITTPSLDFSLVVSASSIIPSYFISLPNNLFRDYLPLHRPMR